MSNEYVALQPIDHLGVRAYNPGDRVPADNVTTHGYEVGVQVAEFIPAPADDEGEGDAEQPGEQAPTAAAEGAAEEAPDTATKRTRGKST